MSTWAGDGDDPGGTPAVKSHRPLARSPTSDPVALGTGQRGGSPTSGLMNHRAATSTVPAPGTHPGARVPPGARRRTEGHRCPPPPGKPRRQRGVGSGREHPAPRICMLVIKTMRQSSLLPHQCESPEPAINALIDEAAQSRGRSELCRAGPRLQRGGDAEPGTMCSLTREYPQPQHPLHPLLPLPPQHPLHPLHPLPPPPPLHPEHP